MAHWSRSGSLPLEQAEHHLLQVLLTQFSLRPIGGDGGGYELEVNIGDAAPTVWRRQQRTAIQDAVPSFRKRARAFDARLKAFYAARHEQRLEHDDPSFPFRFASGGTLPILSAGKRSYYCLAYRDIHPIGWNLANGASDSRDELSWPQGTIERELREELVLIDRRRGQRFVFAWDRHRPIDRPEFVLARDYWNRKLDLDLGALEETPLLLKWINGPDAVTVTGADGQHRRSTGFFLNISAEDFGIEFDRVAWIRVGAIEDVLVLDGEMAGSELVNRPIGLFEVERFRKAVAARAREFLPDIAFIGGNRFEGGPERQRKALEAACGARERPLRSPREHREWSANATRFDLCPVTRQLFARYDAWQEPQPRAVAGSTGRTEYDLFLSAAREDYELARAVRDAIERQSGQRVYFSDETKPHTVWMRAIESALRSSRAMLVVGTRPEHFWKPWVESEWQCYYVDMQSGATDKCIVPIIGAFGAERLPLFLRRFEAVGWDLADPRASANRILELLGSRATDSARRRRSVGASGRSAGAGPSSRKRR